jgi:hypothetical protein
MAKNKSKTSNSVMAYSETDWQAKHDLETLLEAERIKADPERMKAVRKCAVEKKQQMVKDLSSFTDIEEQK